MKSYLQIDRDKCIYLRLEVLRGLSAIFVLIDHAYSAYVLRLLGVEHFLTLVMQFLGIHSVMVFFLLSGYLITLSCTNNIEKHGYFNVIVYIKSRLKRIYPPLILSILVTYICYIIINYYSLAGSVNHPYGLESDKFIIREYFEFSLSEALNALIMNGGLKQPNGPLWSLYLEAQLYILAMFFFISLSSKKYIIKIIYTIALFILLYQFNFTNISSYHFIYSIIWIFGAASFYINRYLCGLSFLKFLNAFIVILLALILCLSLIVPRYLEVGNPDNLVRESSKLMFSLLYAAVIFFGGFKLKIPLLQNALSWCSRFSYSLYVLHYPLLLFGLSLFQGWISNSIIKSTILSLIMCMAIFFIALIASRFVERKYFYINNQVIK